MKMKDYLEKEFQNRYEKTKAFCKDCDDNTRMKIIKQCITNMEDVIVSVEFSTRCKKNGKYK